MFKFYTDKANSIKAGVLWFEMVLQRSLFESYDTFTSLVLSYRRAAVIFKLEWMPYGLMNQSVHLAPFKKIYLFVFATILNLPSLRFDTMYVDNYDTFNTYGAEMEWITIC